MQTTLGPPLMATKGHAAPEVGRAYARARELCAHGRHAPTLPILRGPAGILRQPRGTAHGTELAEQLCAGPAPAEPTDLLLAHNVLADTLVMLGDYAAAWTQSRDGPL